MFIILILRPILGLLKGSIMVTTSLSIFWLPLSGLGEKVLSSKRKKKSHGLYLTIMLAILFMNVGLKALLNNIYVQKTST